MEGHVLQDWLTIRAVAGNPSTGVIMSQAFWFDASAFRDVIAWLDVAEVFVSGADVGVQLLYQTAATCDEALFATLAGPIAMTAGSLTVTQMLGSVQAFPLAKYLRWKVVPSGSTSSTWDVTFRILIALNRPGYRTPVLASVPKPSFGQALSGEEGSTTSFGAPHSISSVDSTTTVKFRNLSK